MNIVEVEFSDEAYQALCEEAKLRALTVAEIVRLKADPVGNRPRARGR